MSELDNLTPVSSGESMLLAAQAVPTSSPINVLSTSTVVPAASTHSYQFSRELEDIRVACKHTRRAEHRSEVSHQLDTIPETQDLDVDLEVVLLHVGVRVGRLPYDNFDPNSITLPMHSTPGIDSLVIGIQTAGKGLLNIFRQYLVYHYRLLLGGITQPDTLQMCPI